MPRPILIAIIAGAFLFLLLIGVALLGWLTTSRDTNTPQPSVNKPGLRATTTPSSDPAPAASINYSASGFSPKSVTVATGSTVTFKNTSAADVQINSYPPRQHTDNEDLNVGVITSGQSRSVTLTQSGTWKYYNYLEPEQQGAITVE